MSENPYQSSDHPAGPAPRKPFFTASGGLLGAIALGLTVLVLLPSIRWAPGTFPRESARRNGCLNKTRTIMLALLNYESAHGSFPPAYTVDAEGNPLHSWRTLILPYMEQQALYDKIDLTKPWDDPANAEARDAVIHAYRCPSTTLDDEHLTTYLAIVGPDAMFPGSTSRTFAQLADTANTICMIEVSADRAVHWMSPYDIGIEELLAAWDGMESSHQNVRIAGYADGHAKSLSLDIAPAELRKMLTVRSAPQSEP